MVAIAGGEPLLHAEIDACPPSCCAANGSSICARTVCCSRTSWALFKPSPTSRGWCTSTACGSATTSRRPRGGLRQGGRRHQGGQAARLPGDDQLDLLHSDSPAMVRDVLDFLNDELKVDAMMISPGYGYETAPDQEHFLAVAQTRRLFARGLRRRPSPALAAQPLAAVPRLSRGQGRVECTPWGIPCYSLLGWQRPCYLRAEGYARRSRSWWARPTGRATGGGRRPAVRDCMAHCGYEPSAVLATMRSCGSRCAP